MRSSPKVTTSRYPVPPGTRCGWPHCNKPANGSIGTNGDRYFLCLEHIAELTRDSKLQDQDKGPAEAASELDETCATLASAVAIMHGIRNKRVSHFAALESEFGPFFPDQEEFARRWLRLQGHDLDWLRAHAGAQIFIEPFDLPPNDRVLIIVLAFET